MQEPINVRKLNVLKLNGLKLNGLKFNEPETQWPETWTPIIAGLPGSRGSSSKTAIATGDG
jgi:hypothetical protein